MFQELAHLVEAGTHERVSLTLSAGEVKGEVRIAFFPVLSESKDKSLDNDEKNALTSNLVLEGTPADLDEVAWSLITEHSSVLADASSQIDEAKEKVKKATTKKAPAKKAAKKAPRKTKAQLKEEARAKQAAEAPDDEFKDDRSKDADEAKKALDQAADAVQAKSPPNESESDQVDVMDDLLADL